MDISRYEIFLSAAECGSFSRVALQFGYTQSGVSHMMRSLETEMGFPLFNRTKDGVILTKDGERILPAIRALVNTNSQLEDSISAITGLKYGILRIGAQTSMTIMFLRPVMKEFHKNYPHVHFNIINGSTLQLSQLLTNSQIDIGFFSKQNSSDHFKYYPLLEDQIVAIVPVDSPLAKKKSFVLEEDSQIHHFIIPPLDEDYEVAQIVRDAGIKYDNTFITNDTYGTMSMVEAGMGISLISSLVLKSHPVNVISLPLEKPRYRSLGMFAPMNYSLSPSTKAFLSYCKKMIPSIVADIMKDSH